MDREPHMDDFWEEVPEGFDGPNDPFFSPTLEDPSYPPIEDLPALSGTAPLVEVVEFTLEEVEPRFLPEGKVPRDHPLSEDLFPPWSLPVLARPEPEGAHYWVVDGRKRLGLLWEADAHGPLQGVFLSLSREEYARLLLLKAHLRGSLEVRGTASLLLVLGYSEEEVLPLLKDLGIGGEGRRPPSSPEVIREIRQTYGQLLRQVRQLVKRGDQEVIFLLLEELRRLLALLRGRT